MMTGASQDNSRNKSDSSAGEREVDDPLIKGAESITEIHLP